MITLRQHIKILSYTDNPEGLQDYFKSLDPIEMLDFKAEIEATYPLTRSTVNYKELPFKAHRKVFDLVLGQFIMVEQIFTGKDDIPKHLFDYAVLRLILRPKHHTEFDNTNLEEGEEHNENVLNMNVLDAYSILNDFIDDRNKVLFNEFAGVFYEVNENKEEEKEEETQEETFEYKFREQWYWYNIVRRLGGENILNYERVYMLKMESVLPELSFLVQKAKVDKAQEFRNRAGRGL
jgi:hypothetical protein